MTTDKEVDKSAEAEVEAGKPHSKFAAYLSQARLKLKPGLNYVLDGFPPVIAVIALIVAVFALNENRSLRSQLSTAVAKLESLSTNKNIPSREDLDKVKASIEVLEKDNAVLVQEKVMHDAEMNQQSERVTKIIQGVSKLQVKMKISPTLEAQMREPVVVPIAAPSPAPKAATAPVAVAVPPPAPAKAVAPAPVKQIILSKPEVPAAATPAPVKSVTKVEAPAAKAPVTVVSGDAKKAREAQVKSIKEQIDEYNKK